MFRVFFGCVMVAAVCITAVALLAPSLRGDGDGKDGPGKKAGQEGPNPGPGRAGPASTPRAVATQADDGKPARVTRSDRAALHQPLTILDARVLPVQRQEVPSEKDGKLLLIGSVARPGEAIPPHREMHFTIETLGVPVTAWAGVSPEDRIVEEGTGKMFRQARPSDFLAGSGASAPVLVRHKARFRILDIGDRVKEGQVLGIINPALALEEVGIKLARVEAAEAEARASRDLLTESERRHDQIVSARRKVPGSFSLDDEKIAEVTISKYKNEWQGKQATVKVAQKELSTAQTALAMHQVRASISGVIRAIYKQPGEAVRNLEPVLQIHNPDVLRVEAQVEVQDALELRKRLKLAEELRQQAQKLRLEAQARGDLNEPPAASLLMKEADEKARVEVEATRQEPPQAALTGHTQEVTCVAITAEPEPRIVSGSEDHTVRVWKRAAGDSRWAEELQLDHGAVVRSLAVNGPECKVARLLTGTATGRARLFTLADWKETMLEAVHTGPINAAAFSHDGEMCVTGGEDASLCVWESATGKLLSRVVSAHRAAVTSASFTRAGQVVSVGRDKRIIVWKLAEGEGGGRTLQKEGHEIERRSGDVPVLGIDPSGERVLFDDGRGVSIRSLDGRHVFGALRNPPSAPPFAQFALFSPDGKTILTTGSAAGRIQLWRAPGEGARSAELRQYMWGSAATCAAFAPGGKLAVTGSADHRVLVWPLPESVEVEKPLAGQLTYVEEFLDTSLRRLTIRATVDNRGGWVLPGSAATIVVPPLK
jgi:WD40 repeat protein